MKTPFLCSSVCRAGYLPQTIPLQIISYLPEEDEFLPWHAASRALYQLDKLLDRTEDYSFFSVGEAPLTPLTFSELLFYLKWDLLLVTIHHRRADSARGQTWLFTFTCIAFSVCRLYVRFITRLIVFFGYATGLMPPDSQECIYSLKGTCYYTSFKQVWLGLWALLNKSCRFHLFWEYANTVFNNATSNKINFYPNSNKLFLVTSSLCHVYALKVFN